MILILRDWLHSLHSAPVSHRLQTILPSPAPHLMTKEHVHNLAVTVHTCRFIVAIQAHSRRPLGVCNDRGHTITVAKIEYNLHDLCEAPSANVLRVQPQAGPRHAGSLSAPAGADSPSCACQTRVPSRTASGAGATIPYS